MLISVIIVSSSNMDILKYIKRDILSNKIFDLSEKVLTKITHEFALLTLLYEQGSYNNNNW